MEIQGKVGVVIGGANGIGRAYCEALLKKGAKVCFGDILEKDGKQTESELQKTYGQGNVCFVKCDVTKEDQIKNIFEKAISQYGPVEIAVNNCGIVHETNWQQCIDINLGGNIRCINAARHYMGLDQGGRGGAYVCTSSISGLRPEEWGPVYSATKHAIVALIRSLAHEKHLKIHGIKMNTICPTRVLTKFLDQIQPGRMYFADDHLNMEEQHGDEISPSIVGDGLVKLLEEGRNGEAMRITNSRGFDFAAFEEQPKQ